MKKACQIRCAQCAAIVKAAAHPSRLFIIEELGKRDRCVCELTEMIGADMSTVSKHLSVLHNAGIVDSRRDGTRVIYHLKESCASSFAELAAVILKAKIRNERAAMVPNGEKSSSEG